MFQRKHEVKAISVKKARMAMELTNRDVDGSAWVPVSVAVAVLVGTADRLPSPPGVPIAHPKVVKHPPHQVGFVDQERIG